MPFPPLGLDAGVYSALQADEIGVAAALRALDERARAAHGLEAAAAAGQLVEPEAERAEHLEVVERVAAAALQAIRPEFAHQDALRAGPKQARGTPQHLRLGTLHVDLHELRRGDAGMAADVVQRIGADALLALQQRVGVKPVVALVLRILVERKRSGAVGSRQADDLRCAGRRGVAGDGLLEIAAALGVRLERQHPAVESRRRQREGAVQADVRADVDQSHAGAKARAEERDLAAFVDAEGEGAGNHRIVRIEPHRGLADAHTLRKQRADRGVGRDAQRARLEQDRIDELRDAHRARRCSKLQASRTMPSMSARAGCQPSTLRALLASAISEGGSPALRAEGTILIGLPVTRRAASITSSTVAPAPLPRLKHSWRPPFASHSRACRCATHRSDTWM